MKTLFDAEPTTRQYRVVGRTDDVLTCELCGKPELTHTVMLEALDAAGNGTGDITYYGKTCAARAAGWTYKECHQRINAYERDVREWLRAESAHNTDQYIAARDTWCQQTYGCTIWEVPDANGNRRKVYDIVKEFDAHNGR